MGGVGARARPSGVSKGEEKIRRRGQSAAVIMENSDVLGCNLEVNVGSEICELEIIMSIM